MSDRLTPALIEIKRASVTNTGEFEGYASTWDNVDAYGDIIEKGAFAAAIREHKTNKTMPALLWSHSRENPIGKWLDLEEDRYGLLATGKLTLGVKRGREAFELLKDDAIALSVGFQVARGGSKTDRGIRTITRIGRLPEISLVACPANSRAQVVSHKELQRPATRKQFEHLLRHAAGYSARESKRIASSGFSALDRHERGTDLDKVLIAIQELQDTIRSR